MVKITYVNTDGAARTVDAELGSTVMETALKHGISGIVAECGGSCICSTCHVYVDPAWLEKVGPRSESEDDTLARPSTSSRTRG
jgi:2Fe-2S ferredoxin